MSDAPLAVQVAVQKQIIALLWDRLALVDAQNIVLNQRLGESLSVVDKAVLALPPPSSDAGPTRRSWQFWKR